MLLVSRSVTTPYTKDEIIKIIKSSASPFYAVEIDGDNFSFMFPIRWHRAPGVMRVKGIMLNQNENMEVRLKIYGGLTSYFSLLFFAIGIFFLLYHFFANIGGIYTLICIGVGIVLHIGKTFDGITCLDSLEHRITRRINN